MTERSEMDNERLSRAYTRYAKDPTVDVNDPDNIIIALEKECEHYRGEIEQLEKKLRYTRGRIQALCKQQMDAIVREQKQLEEKATETTLEAVQDNTVSDIIKALADNGYNTITINCYKGIESEE